MAPKEKLEPPKEAIAQGFCSPAERAAEALRRQADAQKPRRHALTAQEVWDVLKAKGVVTDEDLP